MKKLSARQTLDLAAALASGESLSGQYTLTGVITEFSYYYRYSNGSGSTSFYIDVLDEEGNSLSEDYDFVPFLCYTVTGGDVATIAMGDTVSVTGEIKNYNGTVEFNNGGTVTVVTKGNPTAAEIVAKMKGFTAKNWGVGYVSLSGVVNKITTAYDANFGNVSFTMNVIDEDGEDLEYTLTCYRAAGDAAATLQAGDTVTVTGILGMYNTTPEFMAGSTVVFAQ